MRFNTEEIKNLENPYEQIGAGDDLAEHRDELNKLNPTEKRKLATQIILGCPDEELKAYGYQIEAARTPHNNEDSFHTPLTKAFEVRKRLSALYDPKNKKPHLYLLGEEFNADLFNEYNELASSVIQGKEKLIATSLALSTPREQQSKLTQNICSIFPDSEFSQKMGRAFTLQRTLGLLKAENPEVFFTCTEYNPDLCHEFPEVIQTLLKPNALSIGEKLAAIEAPELRSLISKQLTVLSKGLADADYPFKIIAAKMHNDLEPQAPVATNPNSLFNEANQLRQSMIIKKSQRMDESSTESMNTDNGFQTSDDDEFSSDVENNFVLS